MKSKPLKETAPDAVEYAMRMVWAEFGNLIARRVSERSIAHRLAVHFEDRFPDLDIDCEYNRDHAAPKTVMVYRKDLPKKKLKEFTQRIMDSDGVSQEIAEATLSFKISPYPDIVVHKRMTNSKNRVVIEVKYLDDERGEEGREYDRAKLKAFTDPQQRYRYRCGVFLEISPKFANIGTYVMGKYVSSKKFEIQEG